jgi:hypothetical protein
VTDAKSDRALTFKEMCETIVEANLFQNRDGSIPTAEDIFNRSPTGALGWIMLWYEVAKALLEVRQGMRDLGVELPQHERIEMP